MYVLYRPTVGPVLRSFAERWQPFLKQCDPIPTITTPLTPVHPPTRDPDCECTALYMPNVADILKKKRSLSIHTVRHRKHRRPVRP